MGIDRKWVRAWHDAVLERDAVTPFECLSRVDLMDEEMVRLLKETGCHRIAFGAESGSQKVLDAMSKGIKVDQIRRTAEQISEHRSGEGEVGRAHRQERHPHPDHEHAEQSRRPTTDDRRDQDQPEDVEESHPSHPPD